MRDWIELIKVLIAYTVLIVGVGVLLFGPFLKGKSTSFRLILYIVAANILEINLVFFLFFLQIEGASSFFLFLLLFFLFSYLYRGRKNLLPLWKKRLSYGKSILTGERGKKVIFYHLLCRIKNVLKQALYSFYEKIIKGRWLEITIVGICLLFSLWYDSYHAIHFGGIGAPDVLVHTEWIQSMREGNIFSDGIYPFGFHCMAYLLVTVFPISLITVMRFLGIVVYFYIVLLLYLFLKKCFLSKTAALAGLVIFCFFNIYHIEATMRYQFSLPQEYGMLGLYPAAYFLFEFLQERKREVKKSKISYKENEKKELKRQIKERNRKHFVKLRQSAVYIGMFGLSVSLTFHAHFYVTIIAFFLCLGIVLVYVTSIWKRNFFLPLFVAGVVSLALSILPLGIGYISGKGLQSSLNWAVGVMQGTEDTDIKIEEEAIEGNKEVQEKNQPILKRIQNHFSGMITSLTAGYSYAFDEKVVPLYFSCFLFSLCYSFLCCIFPIKGNKKKRRNRRTENRLQLAFCLYAGFLMILTVPSFFFLPTLMDFNRLRIFIVYGSPIFFAMPLEVVFKLVHKIPFLRQTVNGGCYLTSIAVIGVCLYTGTYRELNYYYLLQYGAALRITEQIIEEYPRNTFTIVSPVDELPFIRLDGFHYEWIDFIKAQEQWKKGVYIPTKYVFFYVEKRPLTYSDPVYMTEGIKEYEVVSSEMANRRLKDNIIQRSKIYAEQRLIVESKAYYFVREYAKHHPQEMTIYYEDDRFICYRLIQDEYYLNNLGIDYKYNGGKDWE